MIFRVGCGPSMHPKGFFDSLAAIPFIRNGGFLTDFGNFPITGGGYAYIPSEYAYYA